MAAYLDFYEPKKGFSIAKAMVSKYRDCPVLKWKHLFQAVEEQLKEGVYNDEPPKQDLVPRLHSFTIDQTGSIHIDAERIETVTLKFYLIDAEVLFSRAPFVKDRAETFSYVKPYL